MIRIFKYGEVPNQEIFARTEPTANVSGIVSEIIQDVRRRGDEALLEYTKKFDKAELESLEVTEAEFEEALSSFDTKLKQAREWLADGQKVRIDMKFRGRMITRQEVGRQVINEFSEKVSDIADMSKAPNLEGNTMSVTYSPKKGK